MSSQMSFQMGQAKMDTGARSMNHPYSSKIKCCYSCEEYGHLSRNCPNKKPRSSTSVVEYYGQEYEEIMAKVPPMKSKKNQDNVTSFHLGNEGHSAGGELWSEFQSNLPKRDISQVICYKCKNKGHYANTCIGKKDISQVQCFKCKDKGHYAKECPKNKTPNP